DARRHDRKGGCGGERKPRGLTTPRGYRDDVRGRGRQPLEDALGESGRRFLAPERASKLFVEVVHTDTPPRQRVIFSRSRARDRCRWLLTVLTGISRSSAISEGARSS